MGQAHREADHRGRFHHHGGLRHDRPGDPGEPVPMARAHREQARAIAGHVKRRGIPIGKVLASPYCRTMETARLAFGKAEAMPEVRGGPVRTDDPTRYDGLKKLMSTPPPKGQNVVISSHGNP